MSNLSASQARAALNALFQPLPPLSADTNEVSPDADFDGSGDAPFEDSGSERDDDIDAIVALDVPTSADAGEWGFEKTSVPAAAETSPPVPVEDVPTNLDSAILADAAMTWECASYRWYRAIDAQGITRVFRFLRGKPVSAWHEHLRSQRIQSVSGPFRTQLQATAKAS